MGALSLLDPTMIRSPSRQSSLLTASSTVGPSTMVDVTGMRFGQGLFRGLQRLLGVGERTLPNGVRVTAK